MLCFRGDVGEPGLDGRRGYAGDSFAPKHNLKGDEGVPGVIGEPGESIYYISNIHIYDLNF